MPVVETRVLSMPVVEKQGTVNGCVELKYCSCLLWKLEYCSCLW